MSTTTKQRTKTPEAAALPVVPDDLAGWRWSTNPRNGQYFLMHPQHPATYTTKHYNDPERAIAEARRWVLSQPKPKPIEEQPTVEAIAAEEQSVLLSPDAAAARLRLRGFTVRPHGLKWLIKQPPLTRILTLSPEDLALAARLAQAADDYLTIDELTEQLYRETGEPLPSSADDDKPPDGWGFHTLPIALIRRDGGTQARVGLDEDTVKEYTEAMREERWDWLAFSRPIVCWDADGYWLADGFHRIEAGQRAGRNEYPVEVLRGGKRAALLRAAGANAAHGRQRTRQDVQRAIELLLRDEEWGKWSDREIARHVSCNHETVGAARRRLASSGEIRQIDDRTVSRGGTTYEMTPAARPGHVDQPYSVEQAFPLTLRKRATAFGAQISGNFDITRQLAAVWLPGATVSRWMSAAELTAWCDLQPITPESRDADGPWFKASKSAAHPTAHHWNVRQHSGLYVAACGNTSPTLPTTGADAGLCSVCAKHGDRRELVPIPSAPTTPAPLPPAPPGWIIYRDGDIIGLEHETGLRLRHEDAAALIAAATAGEHWLAVLSAGDWSVFYDPDCPPELHAYTATHQLFDTQAAHDLPRLAFLAWHANVFEDDLPDWDDELIKALFLAGHDPLDLGKRGLPLGELYHLAGLEHPTTTTAPAVDDGPHLPPVAEWKAAQRRAGALGLRFEMSVHGVFSFYHLTHSGVAGGAVDWPAALESLSRKEAAHFPRLIEQAIDLGAIINPTAYDDPTFVQVTPPKGYQQRPHKLDHAGLAEMVTAWAGAATPAQVAPSSGWWNVGRELRAVEQAINSFDHVGAIRASVALTIALMGDAAALALARAPDAAQTLEVYGHAGLAALLRQLAPETSEAAA